ncbi:hypothetical protein QBC42DRAFT_288978 [Cladorrhinum samala]|uniref:Uncharacterized protein n=1 Tax=Cladorrhinum samala TaxID=585594 RepID=A0AAV9HHJ4_9PEZI|nr:hypothetical protein QBC42DRAFT_288978 [Cladorrhinum samala]
MPTTILSYNSYNPTCTVDACLNQVVGYLDNKLLAQYASCTSLYGAPVVSTVTASPDVVFETVTSTVPYVDVTVEFTTIESTAQEISTSDSGFTSSEAPSPSAPPCTDSAQHFSACACINAVSSDSTATEAAASASTSTIHETVIATSVSTSISTVTLAVTTFVVRPATTTLISTVETEKAATTTVTSTSTNLIAGPTQIASWSVISPASLSGSTIGLTDGSQQAITIVGAEASAGASMVLSVGTSSQPYLASDNNLKLYMWNIISVGNQILFMTPTTAAVHGFPAVTCMVDASTGLVSCEVEGRGWTRMMKCDRYVHMVMPTYKNSVRRCPVQD